MEKEDSQDGSLQGARRVHDPGRGWRWRCRIRGVSLRVKVQKGRGLRIPLALGKTLGWKMERSEQAVVLPTSSVLRTKLPMLGLLRP